MAKESGADDRQLTRLPIIDAGGDASFDPWESLDAEHLPAHPRIGESDLVAELRRVMRRGLPTTARAAGDVLPHLRSVIARSVHPYDQSSRVAALNHLLVRFIIELDEDADAHVMAILFSLVKGTKGTTLESRREKAAEFLSYDATHFRKRIEPELLAQLAAVVYADLLRYKRRVRRAPASEEPTGDTPSITASDFTHQEELVSRIWSHVYALRAELIAAGRTEVDPAFSSQAEDHRQAAERARSEVDRLVGEFTETYGEAFIRHGEAEFTKEALQRLPLVEGTPRQDTSAS